MRCSDAASVVSKCMSWCVSSSSSIPMSKSLFMTGTPLHWSISCFIYNETASTLAETGRGNALLLAVSRLGAIIWVVTTSGSSRTTPVFLKAARIFSGVSALTCARAYTARKFDFVTVLPLSHSCVSRSSVHLLFNTLNITTSRPW